MKTESPTGAPVMQDFKYWAFISYSHSDDRWGRWLHRKLETYRVPRVLAGKPSRDGVVPRRLYPVFRDREELPISADLGINIKMALHRARYLIVICSPKSARSLWVSEEVRYFKQLGRENRVLCFIVDGEPNATDKPGQEEEECFPVPVRFHVDAQGELTSERVEPIAGDARRTKDGPRNALIKLIAGLLGVNYDDLRRRERVRRLRAWGETALLTTLAVVSLVAAWQWQTRKHRLEYYQAQGQQEMEAGNSLRALAWFTAAYELGERGEPLQKALRETSRALTTSNEALDGHTNWIFSASFSPDGARMLTASWDGSAAIWTKTGATLQKLAEMRGHRGKLSSAAFNRDATKVVTAGWDGFAKVWDTNGALLATLDGHRGRLNAAVFSPDDSLILTASDDGTAKLWKPDGSLVQTLEDHQDLVKAAAFSPDGARIATGSFDGTVKLWSTATGQLERTILAHKEGINCVAFTPDGKQLVSAGLDRAAKVWDTASGANVATLAAHRGRLNSCAVSQDGRFIATGADDGTALLWDATTHQIVLCFEGERRDLPAVYSRGKVLGVSFSPDGQRLVTACEDKLARLWELQNPARTMDQTVAATHRLNPWSIQGGHLERVGK